KVAAMERRRAEAARRLAAAAAGQGRPPTLFDDSPAGPSVASPARVAPTGLSVTSGVSSARCPRQFYWSVVRPLPRQSSAAARLGTEVHRWIEARADRQLVLVEPDEYEPATGVAEGLRASFLASVYADIDPERVEAPFQLFVGGRFVRAR